MVWLMRAISGVAAIIGGYLAAQLASRGETLLAVLYLTIAIAYLLATWTNPLSPLLWVGIGAMIGVFLFLDTGVMSITLAIAAAVLFWMRGRKQGSPVDPGSLRPVSPESVMEGAHPYVAELIESGWRQAGAYAFDSPKVPVTVSVLVHPNLDRHAEITDMVFSIESRFRESRILISNSSGLAGLPPSYLTNDVAGASPAELADAHQSALDILAGHDLAPLQVLEHTIVSEAMASERWRPSSGASRTPLEGSSTSVAAPVHSTTPRDRGHASRRGWSPVPIIEYPVTSSSIAACAT